MKLDGEKVLFHGTLDRKSDQKPVGDNNGVIDFVGLRSQHGLESKEQSGAFYDLKSSEGKTDQLQYALSDEDCWAVPKLDSSMQNDDEEKLTHFVAPIPLRHSSLEAESFEKDSVFYVDKSVMEPELPEFVVCYKENTYHVVKDICIDEGVPSNDKFLFDTDVDEQQLCTFLISEDMNGGIGQELGDVVMHIPELLKSSTEKENLAIGGPVADVLISLDENGSRNEFPVEQNLKELIPVGDIEQDVMEEDVNGSSKDFFSLRELLSMSEMGADLSKPKSSHESTDKAEQLAQSPLENRILTRSHNSEESENVNEQVSLVSHTTVSEAKELDFGCEEASLGIPSGSAGKESDRGHDRTQLSSPLESATEKSENDSKEEKSETKSITFDSNSSAPSASQGEEGSQTGGTGHPHARSSSRPEDNVTESYSSQLQYCQGESSFSAAGPVSGLISYSGPIAYSGSLSIRSDSSTTSTRSFAFPILQSEWNSSPVRMAKADRRCIRKHRGWREAILCCRF